MIDSVAVETFRVKVNSYFQTDGRTLPWRTTYAPYHILVSEIMLQQTQVDRVVPKFTSFTDQFPTIEACGMAQTHEILAAWQGLGYNRRALCLQKCCREIKDRWDGTVPNEPKQLESLPGIGRATAAAICVYAFNTPLVYIETNIRSVFIHEFFHDGEQVDDAALLPLVERTLDRDNPRRWYSALMDYGTYLKKTLPNPGRKSRHHTTQPRFEGSHRQLRGAILKIVLREKSSTLRYLQRETGREATEVRQTLDELRGEGFIGKEKNRYYTAHE